MKQPMQCAAYNTSFHTHAPGVYVVYTVGPNLFHSAPVVSQA